MKCPICNSQMKKGKEPYSFGDIKLGDFEAEKCQKCNEVFFTEDSSDKIDKKAQELGIWGMGKEVKVGHSQ